MPIDESRELSRPDLSLSFMPQLVSSNVAKRIASDFVTFEFIKLSLSAYLGSFVDRDVLDCFPVAKAKIAKPVTMAPAPTPYEITSDARVVSTNTPTKTTAMIATTTPISFDLRSSRFYTRSQSGTSISASMKSS